MSNKYGISEGDERIIRNRDKKCVYCHRNMKRYLHKKGTFRDKATIEHMNYLPPWNNPKTVTICCGRCNSSRGKKKLVDWFKISYCLERNINKKTVANVVRSYMRKYPKK